MTLHWTEIICHMGYEIGHKNSSDFAAAILWKNINLEQFFHSLSGFLLKTCWDDILGCCILEPKEVSGDCPSPFKSCILVIETRAWLLVSAMLLNWIRDSMERTMKVPILLLYYVFNMYEHADLLIGDIKQALHSWALSVGFRKCV